MHLIWSVWKVQAIDSRYWTNQFHAPVFLYALGVSLCKLHSWVAEKPGLKNLSYSTSAIGYRKPILFSLCLAVFLTHIHAISVFKMIYVLHIDYDNPLEQLIWLIFYVRSLFKWTITNSLFHHFISIWYLLVKKFIHDSGFCNGFILFKNRFDVNPG